MIGDAVWDGSVRGADDVVGADADGDDRDFRRAPCGLFTAALTGEIIAANDILGRWLGRDTAALVGERLVSFLAPSSRLFYETRHAPSLHLDGQVSEVALSLLGPDGTGIPVLMSATIDQDGPVPLVRGAVFSAADRIAYEEDLLRARRAAEASEARVRILQDISGAFGTSANDQEVADSFVTAARTAFAASEVAVHLFDDDGELRLVAGTNPLVGIVAPIDALRYTPREMTLTVHDVDSPYPRVLEGLRTVRREAISILPLLDEGEHLGVLVCYFGRARAFDPEFLDLQRALGRQASQTLVRVRLQRRLEELALVDPLTRIANRQVIEQRLHDAIQTAQDTGRPVSVVFLDLDDFKSVNDTFGHVAGDDVLRTVAHRLRAAVRAEDTVGRIGGDEFLAICVDADADAAASIAERVRAHTHEPVATGETTVEVSVSVGVAVYTPHADEVPTMDQLLIRADAAMYVSKATGKDRVSVETR